ncbi:uncharacterized protein LOC113523917 [Pangasianodon hypophthalmus]|uniref:uncharacterized protein LOC113523917 n=1 Tax=Pangasianodon hypophthalmus TaxID=310915 RepID=UPI00147A2768|nr:uncharacterized protein LOC113523917 [Pangasianodon hypophthalmus]XP_053097913.1 uncharacterized protein LOC113523917 [Pangasianodon hypophthalmus]XP_053097914.1 uncharacterized protein LOC113523917 [Pangasianodon hypophthalmus]XP_053097915.1 uncharacterized protein LOC113523917 [Pangasianodon hypophthalmus]XP_053097916.1 uncharacterized protein LOC113523917 [Pangasianodon hypophthalmus]
MLICFICKKQHPCSQKLISHLRGEHSYYPGSKFSLICSQHGCRHQFETYAGFRKHLNNVHSNVQQIAQTSTAACSLSEPVVSTSQADSLEDQINPQHQSPCSSTSSGNNDSRRTTELCESIVAKLQSSGIPNSLVSSIVGDLEDLTDELHSQAKHNMLSALPTSDPYKSVIDESFKKIENTFTNLNTEWKRNKYFKEKWGVVEPVEITLGVRYDSRLNQKSGNYDQLPVKDTFIYVPILETLKFMCRNSDICDLLREDCRSEPDTFSDFNDGTYFKTHPLFTTKKHALQIQIYYDDFETANPLGSKHCIHKIGCLYFIVRNLPPKFNSVLMNINLLSLFHTQDISKYGFDIILEPLINDIKVLESQGLSLPFSDEQIYGTIAQITGDNLGMHSILGFIESFSSHHFCRLCLIDKNDSQTVYSEDDPKVILRGKEIYEMHCQSLQENPQLRSLNGLKKKIYTKHIEVFSCLL